MTESGSRDWNHACLALKLLLIDPVGLGGISLRARAGPVRDRFLDYLNQSTPTVRIHPSMPSEALFGGMDVAATLEAGRIINSSGLLRENVCPVMAMAERCGPLRAFELVRYLETRKQPIALLDEGAEPEETVLPILSERLAFHISLEAIGRLDAVGEEAIDPQNARLRLAAVAVSVGARHSMTLLAARLGIDSLRPPLFALNAARALAASTGRDHLKDEDLMIAASLVLAPRAIQLPADDIEEFQNEDKVHEDRHEPSHDDSEGMIPQDILVDAIRPQLPSGLLAGFQDNARRGGAKGSGAGQKRRSNRRGRPLPSRRGRLADGRRIDLIATLRAAAPWQRLRRRRDRVKIRPSDIFVKSFEEKSDRLLVFAVDASGSAAMARLADAKGAVEILLSEAYASRDLVSLIGFRGDRADLLLPPTRSLVQAKRRLAALPGGGGTPLAAGLKAAGDLAKHARSQGMSPVLLLLTDGRANIALDGTAGRSQANADVQIIVRWLRHSGFPCTVIDTASRPERSLTSLARDLAGQYLPLPHADATQLARALT